MTKSIRLSLLGLAAASAIAGAQQRPAIRQLGAVTAKAGETFAGNATVRALSNGSLLVNDVGGRRVLLFDPSLGKTTIVADTTPATANAYASNNAALVAYRGDTTFFIDGQSQSMLVIDPAGKIGKVLAIPRAEDAGAIGNPFGSAAFDGKGHLVYRALPRFTFTRPAGGGGGPGAFTMPTPPDSALIFRVDLATRTVDTVGFVRTPRIKMETKTDDKGNLSMTSLINPLPVVDEWVVTSDGAVAFLRGKDYHIDWVSPDGTKTSSAKIPYDWQRLSDDDKIAFIDSVKAARERMGANAPLPVLGGGGGGAPQVQIFRGPGGPGGGGAAPGAPQFNFIPPSELPDYKPAFFAGALRADRDGNVWIRTTPAVAGGPVYDVVNRKGDLIDRVQVPVGRTIAGFGPDGTVYLLERTSPTGPATLEKASLR
jgi:hypothetical protein